MYTYEVLEHTRLDGASAAYKMRLFKGQLVQTMFYAKSDESRDNRIAIWQAEYNARPRG